jgi:hypothetical protein
MPANDLIPQGSSPTTVAAPVDRAGLPSIQAEVDFIPLTADSLSKALATNVAAFVDSPGVTRIQELGWEESLGEYYLEYVSEDPTTACVVAMGADKQIQGLIVGSVLEVGEDQKVGYQWTALFDPQLPPASRNELQEAFEQQVKQVAGSNLVAIVREVTKPGCDASKFEAYGTDYERELVRTNGYSSLINEDGPLRYAQASSPLDDGELNTSLELWWKSTVEGERKPPTNLVANTVNAIQDSFGGDEEPLVANAKSYFNTENDLSKPITWG